MRSVKFLHPFRPSVFPLALIVGGLGMTICSLACLKVTLPRVDGKVPSGGVADPATAVVLLGAASDAQHAAPAGEVAPRH